MKKDLYQVECECGMRHVMEEMETRNCRCGNPVTHIPKTPSLQNECKELLGHLNERILGVDEACFYHDRALGEDPKRVEEMRFYRYDKLNCIEEIMNQLTEIFEKERAK